MTESNDENFRSFRVRPYLLTGGRTRSAVDLPLEALVRTTESGHAALGTQSRERHQIISLCASPQSVAEISAHLKIHLQVARVLVGDLVQEGHVATHVAKHETASARPDLRLLEQVLDGLHSL